ncbi:MAG: methylated-DNA--[protein]-cysteine S-methyltransferase [Wenzhouxiangella sp.]|jgi:methylated-DNA-[protein]-cysteine S-methyltransferase|nr:methylated-DNA--[protein]-cysteine S-methyltransferase [Wenzhouxiangella sp.]
MNRIKIETPLGPMLVAAGPEGLAGSWFVGQRHFPAEAVSWEHGRTDLLAEAETQLQAYLAGELKAFELRLAPRGTPFQRAVWDHLRTIPYAQSSSYGQIARALGRPSAARAVGTAVGRNPWTLIVPCHRVVGSNGALTGYAGGLARKRWLLALEAGLPVQKQPPGTTVVQADAA